jgi:hypothetical protein
VVVGDAPGAQSAMVQQQANRDFVAILCEDQQTAGAGFDYIGMPRSW